MKRILLVILTLCLFFSVFGCSEYVPAADGADSGDTLTPEYMAEISRALAQTTVNLNTTIVDDTQQIETTLVLVQDTATEASASAPQPTIVTTTASISSNTDEVTTVLTQDSTEVIVITTSQQTEMVTASPVDTTTSVPTGSDIVYWTPGGSVWHTTSSCSSLSRSKEIISGSTSEAIAAGKERVCKRCG